MIVEKSPRRVIFFALFFFVTGKSICVFLFLFLSFLSLYLHLDQALLAPKLAGAGALGG